MDCPCHPTLVDKGGVDNDVPILEADLVHILGLVVVHGPVAPGALRYPARGMGGLGLLARVGGGAVGPPGVSHALLVAIGLLVLSRSLTLLDVPLG